MRTLTAPERALLAGSFALHTRVEIQNASGTWKDLTTLAGINWFTSATWREDPDNAVATGSLTLAREATKAGVAYSLSPLLETSPLNVDDAAAYAPLVFPFRGVRISTAVVPQGTAPGSGDYRLHFQGIIDDPESGGKASVVTVPMRDLGAVLLDAQIEEVRDYASAPLETVLQLLLDDNGFGDVVLHVPVSPGWTLPAFRQPTGSLLEALRAKALDIGWECRYRWLADNTYRLTLYEPRRDVDSADTEFARSEYLELTKLRVDGTTVRTAGRQWYYNGETGLLEYVDYEAPSVPGGVPRRWMELAEPEGSELNSATEAARRIEAAITDLSQPKADHAIRTLFFPAVQIGDVYDFLPHPDHFATTQRWGVVSYSHELGNASGRTVIETRGRPLGAFDRWHKAAGPPRRVDRTGYPTPTIGPMYGEASSEGGVTGEGACWCYIGFDAYTEAVELYTETGATTPLPAPQVDNNSLSVEVTRQEGDGPSAPDWHTWVLQETTPGYYRKDAGRGRGPAGLYSLPRYREAQAVDSHAPTLAAATDFTVARVGADNVLEWTAPAQTSAHAVLWFIRRNGIIIADPVHVAGPMTFTDANVSVAQPQDYEIFPFSLGVTGPVVAALEGAAPAGDRPVFTSGTPKIITDLGLNREVMRAEGTCSHPDCAYLDFETMGLAFTVFGATLGGQWKVVGRLIGTGPGGVQTVDLLARTWRIVARDAALNVLGVSDVAEVPFTVVLPGFP